VLAADAANVVPLASDVLVLPGVLDDDNAPAAAVLDDDELPPQPASTANAASATVTPVKRRRENALTFAFSTAFCSLPAARASVAIPTSLCMPPPNLD
jgi:hypothetical protein